MIEPSRNNAPREAAPSAEPQLDNGLATHHLPALEPAKRGESAALACPVVSVIIPAFNEELRLAGGLLPMLKVLRERGEPFEIIVVDDGSSDGTAGIVNTFHSGYPEVRLERFSENRGKGAAVRHGMLAARGRYLLLADADGATPAEEILRLRARIEEGAQVAIGSRRRQDEDSSVTSPWHRRLLRFCFNMPVRLFLFDGIADTQCGFKMFTAEAARYLFSQQQCERFSFDLELLYLAKRGGLPIAEVPVSWNNVEGSKVHLLKDGLRMLRDIFVIRRMHGGEAARFEPGTAQADALASER